MKPSHVTKSKVINQVEQLEVDKTDIILVASKVIFLLFCCNLKLSLTHFISKPESSRDVTVFIFISSFKITNVTPEPELLIL